MARARFGGDNGGLSFAPEPPMAELKEARVPDIGGQDDVPVIELLVAVGDTVKLDQGLVTLESDKATMEVPAPFAGVVRELKVGIGDKLSEGSVVAMIEAEAAGGDAKPASGDAKPAAGSAKADQASGDVSTERAEPVAKAPTPSAETGAKVEPANVAAQPDRLAERSIEASASAGKAGGDAEASPRAQPASPPTRRTAWSCPWCATATARA